MWIIEARRAVSQDYNQTGEVADQTRRTQDARDSFRFFFRGESPQQSGDCTLGLLGIPHQGELGARLRQKGPVQPIAQKRITSRRQEITDQGHGSEQAQS